MDDTAGTAPIPYLDGAFLAGADGRGAETDRAAAKVFGTGARARRSNFARRDARSRARASRSRVDAPVADRAVQDGAGVVAENRSGTSAPGAGAAACLHCR